MADTATISQARYLALISLVMLAACERSEPVDPLPITGVPVVQAPPEEALTRDFSLESMARGAKIYQEHCAQCHGPQAQGHPGWQEGVANDEFVMAPPLDATGPAVRKSKQALIEVISNGLNRGNDPVMPAWKGRLSAAEIDDTILWFQALWPPEVYDSWHKANAATTTTAGTPNS